MPIQTITIEHDLAAVPVFIDKLAKQALKKAVATSIRRTFTEVKKGVSKEIKQRKLVNPRTLPARDVKTRYLREAQHIGQSMPITDMEARLDFSKRKPALMHFWAKRIPVFLAPKGKQKRGARAMGFGRNPLSSVQVTVMGKTYIAGKAFMPGSTGVRNIFMRKTAHRLPLRTLRGPSFATMFEKLEICPDIQKVARKRYSQEFAHNFQFYLQQLTERQKSKAEK